MGKSEVRICQRYLRIPSTLKTETRAKRIAETYAWQPIIFAPTNGGSDKSKNTPG